MLRTTLISFLLLLAIVAFGIWYFSPHHEPVSTQSSSISAIPINANFIVEVKHPSRLKSKLEHENKLWATLCELDLFASVSKQVKKIDSLINHENSLKPFKDSIPVAISVHPAGIGNFSCLYTLTLPKTFPVLDLPEILNRLLPGTEIKHKTYDGEIISWIQLENGLLYFTLKNKLLQVSDNVMLIEDAVRQSGVHQSLLNESSFSRLIKSISPKAEMNFYVNLNRMPSFLDKFVAHAARPMLHSLKAFNEWMVLDGTFSDTELNLNGFSGSTDSSNSFLSVFKGQQPQPIDVWAILPHETSFMLHYGISNTKGFYHNYKKFLETQHAFFDYTKSIDQFKTKFKRDPEEVFVDRIENELGCFTLVSSKIGVEPEYYAYLRTADAEKDDEILLGLADTLSHKLKQKLDTVNYHHRLLIHLPVDDYLPMLFGQLMQGMHKSYFIRLGNYWVVANSFASLKSMVDKYESGQVIGKKADAPDGNGKNTSESNVYCYVSTPKFLKSVQGLLQPPYDETWDKATLSLRKIQQLTLQFSSANNDFYTHCYLNYNLHPKVEFTTLWDYELAESPLSPPTILIDPATGNPEIAVQDSKAFLYLINEEGKKMWKRKIGDPIKGAIVQLDTRNNGHKQLVFATSQHRWVLDQKGNTVSPFPLKLNAKKMPHLPPFPKPEAPDTLANFTAKQLGMTQCSATKLKDPHQRLVVGISGNHILGILVSLP